MGFTVQVLVILVTCNFQTFAIDMVGCGDSSPLEVRENTQNYVIKCNNIGETGKTVTWDRKAGTGAGSCSAVNECKSLVPVIAVLSRPFYSTSTMTVKSATRALWGNKTVRCYTTQPPSPQVVEQDSCTLDVVYPAEASCSVQTNRWTVGGSCSISKVYSSASRYSCQFFTGLQSSQTTPVTQSTPYTPQPHQDSDYRTGSCDFSNVALSPTKGDYYYKAVIVPGNVQKVFGPLTVDPPIKPNITCTPSSWVLDGSTVSCTCSTSSLGQPAGKLQGFRGSSMVAPGSDDGSLSLTLPAQTVNRSDHGNSKAQFSCAVDWIQDKTSDTHNVPVAWGPANVTIPQSTTFDTDTTGSEPLTLTCHANDVNPTVDLLTYSWTGRCQGKTGSTCTFQPGPPGDDGMEVTCTVTNSYNNNQQRSYTYQLNLNYPPPQAPVITRSPSSQPVYSTDDLTLACDVTGGKPLVTSVSLSCSSRHPDNPNDITGSNYVSSSLQMTLTDDDDGITCSCTAVWKVTSFYTLSDSTTFTVYYPPSTPVISRTDGLVYPYLAGDRVEMICDTQPSRGNPAASLTWSGHGGGQTQTPSGAPATLLFPSVGRGDNSRNITCRASNNFTQVKGQTREDSWILNVFYPPVIGLSGVQYTNDCQLSADKTGCVITEGQRVHINSTADSNPDTETFSWRKLANSSLDLGTTSVLDIVSTDHVIHNGLYNLTVTSGDLGNGRDRLTGNKEFNILVLYMPETTELTVNSQTHNLTLNESEGAEFTCRTNGRPSPRMQLVDAASNVIQSTEGGELTVEDKVTWLNHSMTAACQNTGKYHCDVSSDVGNGPRCEISLFVNCKPRRNGPVPGKPPTANVVDKPVAVTFYLLAYPTPEETEYRYHGRVGNASDEGQVVETDMFTTHCWTTGALYNVSCNITTNITSDDEEGVYSVSIGNTFGRATFSFIVTFNDSKVIPVVTDGLPDAVGIGAGVGGAVAAVAIVAAVAVVVIRKRGSHKPGTHKSTTESRSGKDSTEMIVNSIYETGSGDEVSKTNTNREVAQGNAYEDVDVNSGKPAIQPKPQPATSSATAGIENVEYAIVSKVKLATSPTSDGPENSVYASVDKNRTPPAPSPPIAAAEVTEDSSSHPPPPGAHATPNVKPKPTKPAKPAKTEKTKKNKGKQKEKGKKEDTEPLKKPQEGAVYCNMQPLSMNPPEESVYENCAFEPDSTQDANKKEDTPEKGNFRTVNKDDLVYSTIQFTQQQLKKAEAAPPEREATEYVSIAFGKQAPPHSD